MEFAYVYVLAAVVGMGSLAVAGHTVARGLFVMLCAVAGMAASAVALCFPTATAGAISEAVGSLADAARERILL